MLAPLPSLPTDHPIILVGLMGCGKTTVGRELSKRTGKPFLDMDAVIEEQIGKSIPEIFKTEGEAHFRALETALLRYMEGEEGSLSRSSIISTGGGVVLRPENRRILRQLGYCVWLNVEVSTLILRTARANNRPLLQNTDRRKTLERLLELRGALYAETAHQRLDTTHMDVRAVVEEVLRGASSFYANGDNP